MPAMTLLLAFIVVPIVELYVIGQVGGAIGLWPTLALLLIDSLAGAVLVRREGRRAWTAFRDALSAGRWPGDEVVQGALVLVGGALLLTPGFVTDAVGLLLVLPPTRAVAARLIRARMSAGPVRTGTSGPATWQRRTSTTGGGPARGGSVLERRGRLRGARRRAAWRPLVRWRRRRRARSRRARSTAGVTRPAGEVTMGDAVATRVSPPEQRPLRLRALTLSRIVVAVLTLVVLAPLLPSGRGAAIVLVLVSAVYIGAHVAALQLVDAAPNAPGWVVASLVADACWAGVVVWATGGGLTPFLFVMYVQLVAVTALVGWRPALALAVLDTVAVAVSLAVPLHLGGDLPTILGVVPASDGRLAWTAGVAPGAEIGLAAISLWALVGSTAQFMMVNEHDLRASNRELAVLRALTRELERSLDLHDVCEALASGVVRELGYRRAVCWLASEGRELEAGGAVGFTPEGLDVIAGLRLSRTGGPLATAIEARRPQLVGADDPRPTALADAFVVDSVLVVVPLASEGRLQAVLTAELRALPGVTPRLRDRDERVLATLAGEGALALENARLHADLRALSITDALTGVYNHRHFQQRLQEELDRAMRNAVAGRPRPVALIMADLDHFKQINDRFGHPSGDEVLRTFARLVARVLRSSDVVCRYGGEEFVVILPETDAAQAQAVAERLRESVERSYFIGADGTSLGPITASFGVAAHHEGVPSRSDLVRRSDEALYLAKAQGRNRVVVAPGDESPVHASL